MARIYRLDRELRLDEYKKVADKQLNLFLRPVLLTVMKYGLIGQYWHMVKMSGPQYHHGSDNLLAGFDERGVLNWLEVPARGRAGMLLDIVASRLNVGIIDEEGHRVGEEFFYSSLEWNAKQLCKRAEWVHNYGGRIL